MSGVAEVDDWFHKHAGQSERRGDTRTFVAQERHSFQVVGFYTTVVSSVEARDSTQMPGIGTGRYQVPVVLIAWLGVDARWQGMGVGTALLGHALHGALRVREYAGVRAVLVDAIDNSAFAFYRRLGFEPFGQDPSRLFIRLSEIQGTRPW